MNTHDIVTKVLYAVKKKGATQAEIIYSSGRGVSVSCRDAEVETVENNRDVSLMVNVYKGQSKGSASTAVLDASAIELTVDKALAIAQLTAADEHAGLADADLMATEFRDLHTWHDNPMDSDHLIELALQADAGAQVMPHVVVDEANVQFGEVHSVYANSHGFIGEKKGSNVSASVVTVGKKDGAMEREFAWHAARNHRDLMDPARIGREAAERTDRMLGARKIASTRAPVLFDPSMARTLVGHLCAAISGSALYQEASFLKDQRGQQIFPEWFNLAEDPFIAGGFASRNFDANGVRTQSRQLVGDGVLTGYLLSAYSARRLGMQSTGNAGGAHNLTVQSSAGELDDLIKTMHRGLLVTSLMGQGVNTVTGDYSRGASGFWVENGAIAHPVNELTIAGNLRDMFAGVQAVGSDLDVRSKTRTGSWLLDELTIAGD